MFEGDASFTQVPNAPGGRTYVLKFQSSDQRHFVSYQVTLDRSSMCIYSMDSSGCRYALLKSATRGVMNRINRC
jgi:hypothetical protein